MDHELTGKPSWCKEIRCFQEMLKNRDLLHCQFCDYCVESCCHELSEDADFEGMYCVCCADWYCEEHIKIYGKIDCGDFICFDCVNFICFDCEPQ